MTATTLRSLLLATAGACTLISPALAVDAQKFNISQPFAPTHWWVTQGINPFIEAVAKASDGKITFEVYHAAQLGKETTSVVTSGLAEFGVAIPGYEVEKMPLTSVVELPGLHKTACEGTAQFWEMAKEGGPLYEQEFKGLGVRPLFGFVLNPYEVQTTEKEIDSVADMAGVKLRANGAMAKAVAALGGVPVQVTAPEFYDALTRGTIDGGMWLSSSTTSYGLEPVLKHTVKGTSMGAGAAFMVISEAAYQSWDEETRKIIMEAAAPLSQHMCEFLDSSDASEQAKFVANGNLTLHELSPEEAKLWNDTISSVADDWAKEMDSTGRPGSELLKTYRAIAETK